MIKIIMHGCNGAMGRVISDLLIDNAEASVVAGVDIDTTQHYTYKVYKSLEEIDISADVIIDFSNIKAMNGLLDFVEKEQIPLVLCTTGLSIEQIERVEKISKKVAILRSANMSLGINLLLKLVHEAKMVLAESGFDIEIVEKHHKRKLDAPSGTALALADSINKDGEYEYIYDRSQLHTAREKKHIGISAVRGGTIVGEHDVIFAGEDEIITISHTAYSRKIFGKGAIAAGKFLANKTSGLYNMSDVIQK